MIAKNKFCPYCGEAITPDMKFCGACGGKLDAGRFLLRPTRRFWIIAAAAALAVVLILIICLSGGKDVDFRDVADRIGESRFLQVDETGRAMLIDTNPDDLYDTDYLEGWSLILRALEELNLPVEEIKAELNGTAPEHGIQTREYGDLRLSWQYHPNIGLEVLFELK